MLRKLFVQSEKAEGLRYLMETQDIGGVKLRLQNHSKQPFKQVFREYYPITADDKKIKDPVILNQIGE